MKPQRSHNRKTSVVTLADNRVKIRHQPIPQLQILSANRLDVRIVQLAWIGIRGAACIACNFVWSKLPGVPSPGQPQVPAPSVRSEQRTERAELKPSHVQLSGVFFCRNKPADVGPPVRNPTQSSIDGDGDVSAQRLPRAVDVA